MSLDVYLEVAVPVETDTTIPIREDGTIKHLTREEWFARYPDREPIEVESDDHTVYSANITHNLGRMAGEAGIYKHLWHPDEIGIKTAAELIDPLTNGLRLLRTEPERFKQFNPENGWGTYEGLIRFVEDYLSACLLYPYATVRVWV